VTGEVNKPGPYPLDRPVDALQAIALSGGFSPYAATKRIVIHREENGVEYQLRFNYRDLMSGRDLSGNIQLRPGDVVVVPEKGLFGQ
jgi:polysaccharide export outer membrane protein